MGNCGHRLRFDRGVKAQEWVEPFLDFVPNWSLELDLSERACLRGSLMSMFFSKWTWHMRHMQVRNLL